MPESVSSRRARLGSRLRRLRAERFASGSAAARALGWPQSKVSKIELGRQLPTDGDVTAWLDVCGGTPADAVDVARLLTNARLEHRSFGDLWPAGGVPADQDEIAEAEARATVIAEYQPSLVPGLAQTPAYARAVLSAPGSAVLLGADPAAIDAAVAARVRRQHLLYTPGKRVRVLVGEAALHVRFGDPSVLAGQLDRLVTIAALPTVELGVLPFDRPSPMLPVAGVALLDDEIAWVETLVQERMLEAPEHVAAYLQAFELAMAAAVRGPDVVALVSAVLRRLVSD